MTYWLSGGSAMRGCACSITRKRVVPERGHPTTKMGRSEGCMIGCDSGSAVTTGAEVIPCETVSTSVVRRGCGCLGGLGRGLARPGLAADDALLLLVDRVEVLGA